MQLQSKFPGKEDTSNTDKNTANDKLGHSTKNWPLVLVLRQEGQRTLHVILLLQSCPFIPWTLHRLFPVLVQEDRIYAVQKGVLIYSAKEMLSFGQKWFLWLGSFEEQRAYEATFGCM